MRRISILITIVFFSACHIPEKQFLNPDLFISPPENAKLHAYWQWIDGCVTREGITRDLEAMKEQGIIQVAILCVSMFEGKDLGVKKVKFASDEWFALFRWTLKEAHRLGIYVGIHNSNGWSGSGGPWINPELSMKKYTWTSTGIRGGKTVEIRLKKPQGLHDFFRDVAVVAVKTEINKTSKAGEYRLNGTIDAGALCDGSPVSHLQLKKGDTITITNPGGFDFNRIAVTPYHSSMWGEVATFGYGMSIKVKSGKSEFMTLAEVVIEGANKVSVIDLPETTAKEVKLVITSSKNKTFQVPANLGEVELLRSDQSPRYSPEIPDFLEKAAFSRSNQEQYFSRLTNHSAQLLNSEVDGSFQNVRNISSMMDSTGLVRWDVPEGDWEIFRFGYTTTGAVNNPVPSGETGLECDKMDTLALNAHFQNFPQKLIGEAGNYTGNTFKFLLSDSYECSYTNWTNAFSEEFEKRTGYSIIPWIPVLCGASIVNQGEAEAFLFDFRKVIASLIEENYYRHLQTLCHRNKLEVHAEVIYGNYSYPPLDILKANTCIDFPMTEFWTSTNRQNNIEYTPAPGKELHLPVSACRVYGIPVIGAEAYTGLAHFSESLSDLKPFCDKTYCEGINQFVLHSYVHQPGERIPGFTLGRYGSHFNRHNLYWSYMKEWANYHSRIQYVLQQGNEVSDVLYYLGDQLPQFNYSNVSNKVPPGYNVTACNYDVLKNRTKVINGKIVLNDRDTFAILSLPPFPFMNFETIRLLDKLVKDGAILFSPKPQFLLSRNDLLHHKNKFAELADRMWGRECGNQPLDRTYGKGKILWGMSLEKALNTAGVIPDFASSCNNSLAFHFTHRTSGNTDVYFVASQQNKTIQEELFFRISGKIPEIWDPETGSIIRPISKFQEGKTVVQATFTPFKSCLFVFKPYSGRNISGSMESFEEVEISQVSGKIRFNPSYEAVLPDVPITSLKSLTEFSDPAIRYFAGDAVYTVRFRVPAGFDCFKDSLNLSIGKFGSAAKIVLNGAFMGSFWRETEELNVTKLLKPENVLEVTVTNLYRNRIIGDFAEESKVKNLWTTAEIAEFLDKEKPLTPSGWIGPLKLIKK